MIKKTHKHRLSTECWVSGLLGTGDNTRRTQPGWAERNPSASLWPCSWAMVHSLRAGHSTVVLEPTLDSWERGIPIAIPTQKLSLGAEA